MTELLSDIDAASDAELISRVRGGDVAAYGDLFSRHVDAANRLSRQLVRGPDVDDLVAEAFAKVLQVLQRGGGPDIAFRAYLLTAVRRLHVDKIRAGAKLQTSDDMSQFDPGIPFQDTAVAKFENGAAAKAFASLPERWQLVLWHLEVEGQKPADIAPLLGMSANSVSALAYRAREGLRQAFLTMHLADISAEECRWVNEHLGAYVRKGLARRDTAKVEEHLDGCRRCTAMYLELTEVNSNLSGIIAPLLLGAAATGYLASSGTAAATGVLGLVGRIRDTISANSGAVTAGAVAAGVAAAATAGFFIAQTGDKEVVVGADQSITTTQSPAPSAVPPPNVRSSQSPKPKPSKTPSTSPTAAPATPAAIVPVGALPGTPAGQPGGTPTEPAPTPTPPTPAPGPIPSDLVMSSATLENGQVVITVDGSPELPPSLTVHLAASPAGITFDAGGDCAVSPLTATTATCTPVAPLVRAPFARAATTAGGAATTFTAGIRLAIPKNQPQTSLNVSVSVPEGYTDPDDGNNSSLAFTYTPEANLAMGPLTQADHRVDVKGTDTYDLSGLVTGVPDGLRALTYSLVGDASFGHPATRGCTLDDRRNVTCTNPVDRSPVDFTVVLTEDSDTPVTIAVHTPPGFFDPNATNNAKSTTLVPTPEAELAMGNLKQTDHTVDRNGTDTFHLRSHVTGIPAGLKSLTYTLTGNSSFGPPDTPGCERVDATHVTCSEPATDSDVVFTVLLDRGSRPDITITLVEPPGYVDTNLTNNSKPATLVPAPDFDFAMGPLTQVGDTKDTTFELTSEITGVPAGVKELTFDLSGLPGEPTATFSNATSQGVPCTTVSPHQVTCAASEKPFAVNFVVKLPDNNERSVTITLGTPGGYFDPKPGNNFASIPLTPPPPAPRADFAMSDLTSSDNTDKTFKLTSRISGVPADVDQLFFDLSENVTFGEPTGEGTVDCTFPSENFVSATRVVCTNLTAAFDVDFVVKLPDNKQQAITIRLVVPDGYDDPDPGNNSASTTLIPAPVDVVMDSLGVEEELKQVSRVRAQMSGIPTSATTVEFQLSEQSEAKFTGGDDGATGQDTVDCVVTSNSLATCTKPETAFWADFDVFLPPGHGSETVRITAVAVGVDENGPLENNSRTVTVSRPVDFGPR